MPTYVSLQYMCSGFNKCRILFMNVKLPVISMMVFSPLSCWWTTHSYFHLAKSRPFGMGEYEMFHSAIPQWVFCITGKGGCFGDMAISPRRLKVKDKCLKLLQIYSMRLAGILLMWKLLQVIMYHAFNHVMFFSIALPMINSEYDPPWCVKKLC